MDYAKQAELVLAGLAMDKLLDSLASLPDFPNTRRAASRKPHCYGLPKEQPLMWRRRERSNSLMFEFKTVQSKPTNGLRNQE